MQVVKSAGTRLTNFAYGAGTKRRRNRSLKSNSQRELVEENKAVERDMYNKETKEKLDWREETMHLLESGRQEAERELEKERYKSRGPQNVKRGLKKNARKDCRAEGQARKSRKRAGRAEGHGAKCETSSGKNARKVRRTGKACEAERRRRGVPFLN